MIRSVKALGAANFDVLLAEYTNPSAHRSQH